MEKLLREKRRHGLNEKISKKEAMLLSKGIPVQKIIGFINFDDLQINVNRNVLIPRYETEEVMRSSLKYINEKSDVLDLCCDSGYIGLSIKKKTNASVTLSDITDEAIIQTKENAKMNCLNVNIIKSNMFDNIENKFDLIISNPPYIPTNIKLSSSILNNEPSNALYGGEEGNDFYKIIIKQGPRFLKPNGIIILEISEDNVDYIKKQNFKILNDINKKPRIAIKKYLK